VNCYEKILKTVSAKSLDLPAFEYVNNMHEKFVEYGHIFNYKLQLNDALNHSVDECKTFDPCIADVKSKLKSSELKFDIGFGKLVVNVDYISLKSLGQINEYLVKNFSPDKPTEEEVTIPTGKVMLEYFSEAADSMTSSQNSRSEAEQDESDEFVLITSENFGDASKGTSQLDYQVRTIASKEEKLQGGETDNQHKLVVEKRESDSDGYEFDTEALFRNKVNPPNKFKLSFDEEQYRLRCNSDNTACTRFK
jgi:hypothetical protein